MDTPERTLSREELIASSPRLAQYIAKAESAPMIPAPRYGYSPDEALERSRRFRESMARRRTIREYSPESVEWELIENAVAVAGRAPSGANQQPWTYVIVSDPAIKAEMRAAIEREEYETYARRASEEWLEALAPLGTDWEKEHITKAPYVAVVFAQAHGQTIGPDGEVRKVKHYYVSESVGISVGFFLAALAQSGLATLTHTPNPMGVLGQILGRPENERCYVVIPIGHPAPDARVPAVEKKPLETILIRK